MFIVFEDRPSDSPFVERVWRCHSERAGRFHSVAATHWEMVVSRVRGGVRMTVRGPEIRATAADCPADGEWLAIRFKLGTYMPRIPAARLLDRNDLDLPGLNPWSFWLDGEAWEYPDFENTEDLVGRLAKAGLIARDPAVEAALAGEPGALSRRSTQRHFLQAMGMTHSRFRQIRRARHATHLLREGASILDAVHEAGYFDQAHLTRSLKRLVGQTPGRILRQEDQLSFLYKAEAFG